MYPGCILTCLLMDVTLLGSMAVTARAAVWDTLFSTVSCLSPACILVKIQDTVSQRILVVSQKCILRGYILLARIQFTGYVSSTYPKKDILSGDVQDPHRIHSGYTQETQDTILIENHTTLYRKTYV